MKQNKNSLFKDIPDRKDNPDKPNNTNKKKQTESKPKRAIRIKDSKDKVYRLCPYTIKSFDKRCIQRPHKPTVPTF